MACAAAGEASIVLRRPAADVAEFVTTPENDPLWVVACAGIRRRDPGPIRLGSRLSERVRLFGVVVPYEWEVTRLEPAREITYTSRKGLVPMVITIAVDSRGDDATVRQRIELRVPRFVPLAAKVARAIARREARRNLAMLKRRLEAPHAPPPS